MDAMVMEANRRVSIVMVGAALDGLREGRFGGCCGWRAGVRSKIAYRWAWGDPTLQGSNGRCDPSYRCLSGNSLGADLFNW